MSYPRQIVVIFIFCAAGCSTSDADSIRNKWRNSGTAYAWTNSSQNPRNGGLKLSDSLLERLKDEVLQAREEIAPRDVNLERPIYVYAYDRGGHQVGFMRTTGNSIDICFEAPNKGVRLRQIIVARNADLVALIEAEVAAQRR